MDAVLKVAEKTSGRDKICRLVQYGSKALSWLLELKGANADVIKKIRDLEIFISTARKLFRLGTSVDNFRAALLTIHLANPLLRFLLTMVRINRGLFLLIDHLIWAAQMKLVTVDTRFWSRLSNQFWAVSILLSLLRDLYELIVAIQLERNRLIQHSALSPSVSPRELVGNVTRNNRALVLDTVKNLTDIWLPTSRLDLVHCPSGVVGIMGVISSAAGLMATYDQCWKLKFS